MPASIRALALACGLGLAGCTDLRLDPDYAGPAPLPDTLAAPFAIPGEAAGEGIAELIETTSRYTITRVRLEGRDTRLGDHDIVLDHYDLPGHEPGPVILVLPISGGGNSVARHFAAVFARRGFAACIVHRQEQLKDLDELDQLNLAFEQIVLDHKQAIDWLLTRPDVDPERIGLFGVSAGAVKGAILAGLESRISATVLGLVGGDVPGIFAWSAERGIAKRRRRILEENDIGADELYRVLADEFRHDPLRYAPYVDARRTLLILARFDAVIPYRNGMRLREAMGNPRTIVLPTGHYGAVLCVPCIEQAAASFFRKQWASEPAP